MKKICLIRGEKNYIINRKFTYDKRSYLNSVIKKWSDIIEYDYWEFRQKLRDITISNVEKQNFDKIFYSYEDLYFHLMFEKQDEDILFFALDDDDIILTDVFKDISYKTSNIKVWDWLFVHLPEGSYKQCKDEVIQSNHCSLYIKKEDIEKYILVNKKIFNYPGRDHTFQVIIKDYYKQLISLNNIKRFIRNKISKKNINHLFYHTGLDYLTKCTILPQFYTKEIKTINFLHVSSVTNLVRLKDLDLIKYTVSESLNTLERFQKEYNIQNESIFEIMNLYEHLK